MAQIVTPEPGFGQLLGSGFGAGISSTLQNLAQQKAQEMQQRKVSTGLSALGFSPQEAQQLAMLPENLLAPIVKQKSQESQNQAFAQALGNILGQPVEGEFAQAPAQAPFQAKEPSTAEKLSFKERQQVAKYLSSPEGKKQFKPEDRILALSSLKKPTESQVQAAAQIRQEQQGLPRKQAVKATLSPDQAYKLAQLGLKKEEITEKRKSEAFKMSAAERKEIINKARVARQDLKDLDRMEELDKSGKLDTAGYSEFLKRSGLDIPALMNPESEEFGKIAANFLRDAKQYFGGRISNYEIEQFLKTIPSLSQSPEGRKRVIANLRYMKRADLAYNEALKEVISDNKGIPPYDLLEKVDDKIEKKLEKLSDKFKEELARPVPESQNKLITAAQAGLGSLVGAPGALLGKIGSLFA
jgi:hypothetical protein